MSTYMYILLLLARTCTLYLLYLKAIDKFFFLHLQCKWHCVTLVQIFPSSYVVLPRRVFHFFTVRLFHAASLSTSNVLSSRVEVIVFSVIFIIIIFKSHMESWINKKKRTSGKRNKDVVMAVCHSEMIELQHLIISDLEVFFFFLVLMKKCCLNCFMSNR